MPFEERPCGRLHDPARLVSGADQGEERGQGVDHVADGRQPDEKRPQRAGSPAYPGQERARVVVLGVAHDGHPAAVRPHRVPLGHGLGV